MSNLISTAKNGSDSNTSLGFRSLPSLSSWMDDIFNRSFGNEFVSNFNTGITLPAVNVLDNDEEYEVEMAIVFGRSGKYISATRAYDHVFGYMVAMDISDRGGRPPGGYGLRSDWFVGKGHDTFAPHGPWIVPKEFYGDPMERLHQVTAMVPTHNQLRLDVNRSIQTPLRLIQMLEEMIAEP